MHYGRGVNGEMKNTRHSKTLLVGSLVMSVSMMTAWAVGRDGSVPDATPMDELITSTAS